MIEIRLHDDYTIRVDGANRWQGGQLTTIPNREFVKRGSAWLVPLSRLGQVIRIVGQQNVSIDYDVFRARDAQLRRIVDQYAAAGCRIWNDGGVLATDNEILTQVLTPIAPLLLDWLPTEPGPRREVNRREVRASAEVAPEMHLTNVMLTGIKNAHAAAERDEKRKARQPWFI